MVCLQEMKLEIISDYDVIRGTCFNYAYLPAVQTHGDILVAWRAISWVATNTSSQSYSVSVRIR
jgi:hypothetical protein